MALSSNFPSPVAMIVSFFFASPKLLGERILGLVTPIGEYSVRGQLVFHLTAYVMNLRSGHPTVNVVST
jgi:hypothetical protein